MKTLFTTIAALVFAFALHAHAAPLSVAGVTASSHQDGNPPEHMIDGDLGTRWSAFGAGESAVFELSECEVVDAISVAFYRGDTRTAALMLDVSIDGSEWTNVFSGESSGTTNGLQPFDIDNQTACFVRLVGLGNAENQWNSITEVQINGVGDEIPPPPACLDLSALSPDDQDLVEALFMRLMP